MSLSVSDFAESEVDSLDESVEVDEESSLVLFLVSALLDESDLDVVAVWDDPPTTFLYSPEIHAQAPTPHSAATRITTMNGQRRAITERAPR